MSSTWARLIKNLSRPFHHLNMTYFAMRTAIGFAGQGVARNLQDIAGAIARLLGNGGGCLQTRPEKAAGLVHHRKVSNPTACSLCKRLFSNTIGMSIAYRCIAGANAVRLRGTLLSLRLFYVGTEQFMESKSAHNVHLDASVVIWFWAV